MARGIHRRDALVRGASAASALAAGDLSFLSGLRPVSAGEAKLDPQAVRFDPAIEPLVRLLEDTPRERVLEEVAQKIRMGTSYREVLAALLLAGVRNVQPRPSVGYKFHAVLAVNSCHLASLASPQEHRWLPIFWGLDYFKSAQARDVRENDWTMGPVDESAVPKPHRAREQFVQAMQNWDEPAADAAIAGLVRSAGANEVFELFARLGCRDFRSIGHKAIFVSNAYRTLQCIGWRHAEPVVRSLAYALLMHEGGNPAQRDAEADRPYRRNQELVGNIRADWRTGQRDDGATRELLETLRHGSNDDACDEVVATLNAGVSPQSVWDALFARAGEMLMQQTGIVALHAVTTTNATSFAFRHSANDETRRMLMLQTAAFLPMFREAMQRRGRVKDVTLADVDAAEGDVSLEGVFGELRKDPQAAIRGTLKYLQGSEPERRARDLTDFGRVLIFLKGDDAHDYKFSSAIFEDYQHVSPKWRDLYLASNVVRLHGSTERDNALVDRVRAAFST